MSAEGPGFAKENPQIPEKRKAQIEDVFAFGEMLADARYKTGKETAEIEKELEVKRRIINRWENGEEFPEEFELPEIARAYQLELSKVVEMFHLSREAEELGNKSTVRAAQKEGKGKRSPFEAPSSGRHVLPKADTTGGWDPN